VPVGGRLNSRVVFWGNLVLGAGILGGVMYFYGGRALDVLRLDFSLGLLVGFLAVVGVTLVSFGVRWSLLMGGLCTPPGIARLTFYRSAAHSLAVLLPSGKLAGDPFRAWLATRAGVSAPHAIASTVVDRTLEMGSSAPFSVLFAVLLLQHGIPQLEAALVTITAASVALVVGVMLAVRRLRRGAGLVTALVRSFGADRWGVVDARMHVIESSELAATELAGRPRLILGGFALGLLSNLLVIAEFYLLLNAFGLPADTIAVVGAIFATGAAHMFPVPAGVGVLEGAQMGLFEMLGYTADVGLAVGLAVRFRELLWMAPGLIYLAANNLLGPRSELPRAHPV